MKTAIYGVGAVGGWLGASLLRVGRDVSFVARGDQLRAIAASGLLIEDAEDSYRVQPSLVTADPHDIGPVDVILVGVKAWQVSAAAGSIHPLLHDDTIVLPIQNGIDAPEELSRVVGPEPVLGGLAGVFASLEAPGHIRKGEIGRLTFGELAGGRSPRTEALLELFAPTSVEAGLSEDICSDMWNKLVFISGLSGVGATTRVPVGVWRQVTDARALHEDLLTEAIAVATAAGARLADDALERIVADVSALDPGVTASMQRDIVAGRPSELEYQNGAIVRHGADRDVITPTHLFVCRSLRPQESLARCEI